MKINENSFNENDKQLLLRLRLELIMNFMSLMSSYATTDANLKNLENYLDYIKLPRNAFNLVCGDFNINFFNGQYQEIIIADVSDHHAFVLNTAFGHDNAQKKVKVATGNGLSLKIKIKWKT